MNPTRIYPAPAKHFRPQSDRQRRAVLHSIDAAERAALGEDSLTGDPYRLGDGIPVLRMVHSRHERATTEPVPFDPMPWCPASAQAAGADDADAGHPESHIEARPPFTWSDWALAAMATGALTLALYNVAPLVIALAQRHAGA